LPEVNLLADSPTVQYGTVSFTGPATVTTGITYVGPQELDLSIFPVNSGSNQPLVPPGAYDLQLIDPDGTLVERGHAVDFVLPPQVSGQRSFTICQDRNETIVVSGSNFTPGTPLVTRGSAGVRGGSPGLTAASTGTAVTITAAAGAFPQNDFFDQLFIEDVSGCIVSVSVTVTQGCGP
jgi:hypothetical protein